MEFVSINSHLIQVIFKAELSELESESFAHDK